MNYNSSESPDANHQQQPVPNEYRDKNTSIGKVLPCAAQFAENKPTWLRYINLDGEELRINFRSLMERDPWPLPMPVDREGYGTVETSHQYWASGHGDWLNVQEAIDRYMAFRPAKLLDFGCSTGRFLRHVRCFSSIEPCGCDYAPANIEWIHRHIPGELNLVLNTARPELPWPDGHFDVVTAFSVFSHIDQLEEEWLLELRRITRPDGLLYLTIQNQATWDRVIERPGSLEQLSRANAVPGNLEVNKELFERPMPRNRIVFRMSTTDVYNSNVWMTSQYVTEHWGRLFRILKIADKAHTRFQAAVILSPEIS